jgi:hypothetical protein
MRLYSKTGATQVDDPEFGSFVPDASGAFDGLPDGMFAKLHGRPGWESEDERALRLAAEELERFRDPATLLAEVRRMTEGQGAVASLLAQALGLTPPATEAQVSVASPPAPSQLASVSASEAAAPEVAPEATAKSAPSRGRGAKAAKSAAS